MKTTDGELNAHFVTQARTVRCPVERALRIMTGKSFCFFPLSYYSLFVTHILTLLTAQYIYSCSGQGLVCSSTSNGWCTAARRLRGSD